MPGVGIDLLEIDRMEQALARRPNLADRLFTPAERAQAESRGNPGRHLAARFCAKEAVVKALALESWNPHDIEVVGGGHGPPAVVLRGEALAAATRLDAAVEISLTHSRETAGAVAMLVPR